MGRIEFYYYAGQARGGYTRGMNPRQTPPRLLSRLRGALALVLSVSVLLSGCTTLTTIPVPAPNAPVAVNPGDKVVAHTHAGQKLEFTVKRIEPTALVGEHTRVEFADIAKLEVRRPDEDKTVILFTVGLVAACLLIMSAFPGEFTANSGWAM